MKITRHITHHIARVGLVTAVAACGTAPVRSTETLPAHRLDVAELQALSPEELAAAYSRAPVALRPSYRVDVAELQALSPEELAAAYSRAPVALRPSYRVDVAELQALSPEELAAAYSRAPVALRP